MVTIGTHRDETGLVPQGITSTFIGNMYIKKINQIILALNVRCFLYTTFLDFLHLGCCSSPRSGSGA